MSGLQIDDELVLGQFAGCALAHGMNQIGHVRPIRVELEGAALQAGHVEQVLDQLIEPRRRRLDALVQGQTRGRITVDVRLGQAAGSACNGGDGRPQFVRNQIEQGL